MQSSVSPEEFTRLWAECGRSASALARRLGITIRSTQDRRARLIQAGHDLPGREDAQNPGGVNGHGGSRRAYAREHQIDVPDGVILCP
jgi:hypothetical protein